MHLHLAAVRRSREERELAVRRWRHVVGDTLMAVMVIGPRRRRRSRSRLVGLVGLVRAGVRA